MSVDILQEKIRKLKNPAIIDLTVDPAQLPPHILEATGSPAAALEVFCRELLGALKGVVPGVRFSFGAFGLLGAEGMDALERILHHAHEQGFYVLLDAPELLSPAFAELTARSILGQGSRFFCDGLLVGAYGGSDIWKPFLPYCKDGKKDLFVVVRTTNKSAPELQDLLAGTRLVHVAAADHVNRYGGDSAGKSGYYRVGIMAAASSADSLRNLRSKYPKLFLLLDGYDYPNANAKNCSFAFDRVGHGAAACAGTSVTCAWQQGESQGTDYLDLAVAAAQRMKKNLTRYVTVL